MLAKDVIVVTHKDFVVEERGHEGKRESVILIEDEKLLRDAGLSDGDIFVRHDPQTGEYYTVSIWEVDDEDRKHIGWSLFEDFEPRYDREAAARSAVVKLCSSEAM